MSWTFSTEVYGSLDREQHNAEKRSGGIPLESYTTVVLLLSAGYQRMVFVGPSIWVGTIAIYRRRKQTKILKSVIRLCCHSTKFITMSVQKQFIIKHNMLRHISGNSQVKNWSFEAY